MLRMAPAVRVPVAADEVLCLQIWTAAGLDDVVGVVVPPFRPFFRGVLNDYVRTAAAAVARRVPGRQREEIVRVAVDTRQFARAHAARLRSGSLMGDIAIVTNAVDDEDRISALNRLAERVPWKTKGEKATPGVERALRARADEEGVPWSELRRLKHELKVEALVLVLGEVGRPQDHRFGSHGKKVRDIIPAEMAQALRERFARTGVPVGDALPAADVPFSKWFPTSVCRAAEADLLQVSYPARNTKDALDPERERAVPLEAVSDSLLSLLGEDHAAEAQALLARIRTAATPKQRELLDALQEEQEAHPDATRTDAARRLGKNLSTAGVQWSDLERRARAVRSEFEDEADTA